MLADPNFNEENTHVQDGAEAAEPDNMMLPAAHNVQRFFEDSGPQYRKYLRSGGPDGPSWRELRRIINTLVREPGMYKRSILEVTCGDNHKASIKTETDQDEAIGCIKPERCNPNSS